MTARLTLSPEEISYYDTLFTIAGPDMTGFVSGKSGAQFLSTSGLDRDTLHKIWSISDVQQAGRLDREAFSIACRLVAHAQSGRTPDVSLAHIQPGVLPMFEGLKKKSPSMQRLDFQADADVISISDFGENNFHHAIDVDRASGIARSLTNLGLDPLEFIPFQSNGGGLTDKGSSPSGVDDWKLTEVNRQKYIGLFNQLNKSGQGSIDGATARKVLEKSGLRKQMLGAIWEMADLNRDGCLDLNEFLIAMHLATKCKKGSVLPREVPGDLLEQVKVEPAAPRSKTTIVPEWKYTSLNEHESSLRLNADVDEAEEELRYTFDLCAQVESDIARMKMEADKSTCLVTELGKELRLLTERKLEAVETRKRVNIDKISLGRDKTKLQSEIVHLKNLINEGTVDVDILRCSVKEIETEVSRVLAQTSTLSVQRKEAGRQHGEELGKIESEQRETGELVDSFNRLGREEEVKLQSEKLQNDSRRIIEEMQRNPKSKIQSTSVFSTDRLENKWATTMLESKK